MDDCTISINYETMKRDENGSKTALVTGATKGIGLELAKLFASNGYTLVIVAKDPTELTAAAIALNAEFGVKVTTVIKDLLQPNAIDDLRTEMQVKNIVIHYFCQHCAGEEN